MSESSDQYGDYDGDSFSSSSGDSVMSFDESPPLLHRRDRPCKVCGKQTSCVCDVCGMHLCSEECGHLDVHVLVCALHGSESTTAISLNEAEIASIVRSAGRIYLKGDKLYAGGPGVPNGEVVIPKNTQGYASLDAIALSGIDIFFAPASVVFLEQSALEREELKKRLAKESAERKEARENTPIEKRGDLNTIKSMLSSGKGFLSGAASKGKLTAKTTYQRGRRVVSSNYETFIYKKDATLRMGLVLLGHLPRLPSITKKGPVFEKDAIWPKHYEGALKSITTSVVSNAIVLSLLTQLNKRDKTQASVNLYMSKLHDPSAGHEPPPQVPRPK